MAVFTFLFAVAGCLLLAGAGLGFGSARLQPQWLGFACLAVAVVLIPAGNALAH